ncbi:transcription elongation factor [Ochrobactrum sp. MYb15]|uniref:GreA/GreB family elongation factor n=1 Tax=Brucella TaxID=234 RepID=UPI000465D3AC|nr:GreA/GreB family elongation factor [Brucella rhizosphaerae]PQZ49521.1 transcription elongation factor [Ochrobactrum sp. MYb19]PRA57257.1 transcription elongation factor [Ochrobactrum sp. MYb68]PRA66661.1 transcription elongation factor [Ochrobactrum sp. MYb18]PRA76309.1 transcription elongation factor [Brucella thiophenivorans]PRA91671.1 transcription elongation factor [Ochrobactrum sp. MYb14]PRA98316.1 transcription elongation factor [Ochrobactrum sp. MYb15]
MSRAFTKEQDDAPTDLGERPISQHRNLVTPDGMKLIEDELVRLQRELAEANVAGERSAIARLSRDLRYWTARRETAELSVPEPDSDVVRFGMTVDLEDLDGTARTWTIVGEDEADPAKGKISHMAPVAIMLFGKPVGDVVTINGKEWEIVAVKVI